MATDISLRGHLESAQRRILQGERRINGQRVAIRNYRHANNCRNRSPGDLADAEALLVSYRELQKHYVAERERILLALYILRAGNVAQPPG